VRRFELISVSIVIALVCLLISSSVIADESRTSAVPPIAKNTEREAEGPQGKTGKGLDGVSVRDGRVTLDVTDVTITQLLKKIAELSTITITLDPGIEGVVSIKMTGVTVEEALKELCRNRAIVYEYVPETNAYRILSVGVHAGQKESGGAARTDKNLSAAPPKPQTPAAVKAAALSDAMENLYDSKGRLLYKPRELLIKFKRGVARPQMEDVHRALGSTLIKTMDRINLHRVKVRDGLSEKEAVALYGASAVVDRAERHALRYKCDTLPNDPDFGLQWNLKNTAQTGADIHAPEAWDIVSGGKEVLIAVIDTGVDYNHPDLQGRIWMNPGEAPANGVDDDQNGFVDDIRGWDFAGASENNPVADNDPMDKDGHGTHVAGIIAAQRNNGIGVAGIFSKARIIVLKVQADDSGTMNDFDIIHAIDYARAKGARIINCSFGGESPSRSEYEAFEDLKNAGILAVCAAGNDGLSMDDAGTQKTYPAFYAHSTDPSYPPLDNIISVAASDQNDFLASFSDYGKNSVDVMAPGVNIYSTCLSGTYCSKQGTSMATPHVTGIAGLILSQNPALTYAQVKSAILDHVDPLSSVADKLIYGGRVNAFSALSSIRMPGDLTGDGRIQLGDLILGLQILSGMSPIFASNGAADVNKDSRIGLEEVIFILQWMADLRGNSPPVLSKIGNKTIPESMTISFTISATDEDGDTLTYSASGLPSGALFNAATKTFTWTPTYSQSGTYPVTFRVEDGHGGSNAETMIITVIDAAPIFTVADYYPLNVDDWWDYNYNASGNIRRTRIAGTKDINGVSVKIMEEYDGAKDYIDVDQSGVRLYGEYAVTDAFTGEIIYETPALLMKDNAGIGTVTTSPSRYSFLYGGITYHVDVTSVTTVLGIEDVTTANTTLKDCIKVSNQVTQHIEELNQTITNIAYYWFYKGVGTVKQISDGDVYVITGSHVNGVTTNY
jgi:subtilisin family serine protease